MGKEKKKENVEPKPKLEPVQAAPASQFPSFKPGNSLPAVNDEDNEDDDPLAQKAKKMFDDLDLGDDEDDEKKGAELDFE